MARVLATSPTYFPIIGGAELLIDDVLTMLSDDHDVRLLTPYLPEYSRPFWSRQREEGEKYEVVRFEDRYDLLDVRGHKLTRGLIPPVSLSGIVEMARHAKDFEPDLLLTFFGIPFGLSSLAVKARYRLPLAVVLCGSDLPGPRTAAVPAWGNYLRATTAGADRAIYVSRFCFDALERRQFDPTHDAVIHGGVDASLLLGGDAAAVRRRHSIDSDEVVFFCLSRLGPEKRLDVVVRAFAHVVASGVKGRLVLGGQGSERDVLEDLARDMGLTDRVIFTGELGREKADYFAACDVFVFHSVFETFGQVVAEAMTCGKPVVSVRAGAIPEVVDEGVTGLLVEPLDDAAFAGAMKELAESSNARARMGAAGRAKALSCFDWVSRAQEWTHALGLDELSSAGPLGTRDSSLPEVAKG